MNDLEKFRKEIDKIDKEIVEKISERTCVVYEIAKYKVRQNISAFDKKREEVVIDRVRQLAVENHIEEDFIETVYKIIIEYCRGIQKMRQ